MTEPEMIALVQTMLKFIPGASVPLWSEVQAALRKH